MIETNFLAIFYVASRYLLFLNILTFNFFSKLKWLDPFIDLQFSAWYLFNMFPRLTGAASLFFGGVDIYLIRVKMQSREFTVGLWLPNWRTKVDDPFIGSICAHTRPGEFNGWNIYESRPDRIHEDANVGDFLLAWLIRRTNLPVSPVRTGAHAFLHFLHSIRSNSPVFTSEWHSHSSGIRHSISNFALAIHAIPRCFSTESNTILPCHTHHTQPFLVFRVSVGLHLVTPLQASSLPQTFARRADSHLAKRIHRTRVICFPVNSSREDRRCRRGFTEDSKSRVFLLTWLSNLCRWYSCSERKEDSKDGN